MNELRLFFNFLVRKLYDVQHLEGDEFSVFFKTFSILKEIRFVSDCYSLSYVFFRSRIIVSDKRMSIHSKIYA